MLTIASDPKHLGARIGITSVLHTWGSTLTHHPHVHMIVPGGGIALDGSRWVSCRSRFFLPWRVLAKLFRRLMLEKLVAAHAAGQLQFFGQHSQLAERAAFIALLAPLRKIRCGRNPTAQRPTDWTVPWKQGYSGITPMMRRRAIFGFSSFLARIRCAFQPTL